MNIRADAELAPTILAMEYVFRTDADSYVFIPLYANIEQQSNRAINAVAA